MFSALSGGWKELSGADRRYPAGSFFVGTRDRIINEAKERARLEGDRLMEEMKKQIETEKESAIRDIRRQVAVLSVGIAEKVMRSKLADEKEQMELIDRMLDEMIETSKK